MIKLVKLSQGHLLTLAMFSLVLSARGLGLGDSTGDFGGDGESDSDD